MKIIKKVVLMGLLWYVPLQAQTDSIVISPYWHTLQNYKLSADGKWASVMKAYEENNDTIYILNTKNGAKKEIVNLSAPEFVGDFVVGTDKKSSNTLRIIPFKRGKERTIDKLLKHQSLEKLGDLITIDTDSVFRLEKLAVNANQLLLEQNKIIDFDINKQQTYGVLYSEKGEELTIYGLDLNTLKLKEFLQLKGSFPHDKVWNTSENKLLVQTKNKELLYLDINNGLGKVITLENTDKISEVKTDFSSDDKLMIRVTLETDEPNEYLEHVDIWNGNDRNLERKMYLKKGNKYVTKNLVYDPRIDVWQELKVQENQELVFINNSNYAVVLDRWKYTDYSHYYPLTDISIQNLKTQEQVLIAEQLEDSNANFTYAPNGEYVAYKQEGQWTWIEVATQKSHSFKDTSTISSISKFVQQEWIWGKDGESAYVIGNQLWKVNLKTGRKKAVTNFTPNKLELKVLNNSFKDRVFFDSGISSPNSIEGSHLVLLTHNPNTHEYGLYTIDDKDQLVAIYQTPNKISKVNWSADFKTLVFNEENFNLPHRVVGSRNGKTKVLLANEQSKALYIWRKQKVIHYKDKFGVDLTAVLWYPKGFELTEKYPMITWVYERQGYSQSEFEMPSYFNPQGFNRSLLTEQGYFVFQPDTYVSEEGSGLSALECVTKGIEVITSEEPSIDKTKLGLMGHSFGGYQTSFILGNSKLFAAGVSGAGVHDLIHFTYEYNYALGKPNFLRVEGPQQDFRDSFGENSEKYFKNSPILFAQNYKTPVLLWTGLDDYNSHWEQTRHMYIALKRYNKPVIALFYSREGHSFSKSKQQIDLSFRILNWFDYYLKDKKQVEWIAKGMNYSF